MEYELHRCGFVQSVVSGPRIPGFKITQAKILHELKTSFLLYEPFQISLILLMSDVLQLTLRITQSI
jgi:hypothetical protein